MSERALREAGRSAATVAPHDIFYAQAGVLTSGLYGRTWHTDRRLRPRESAVSGHPSGPDAAWQWWDHAHDRALRARGPRRSGHEGHVAPRLSIFWITLLYVELAHLCGCAMCALCHARGGAPCVGACGTRRRHRAGAPEIGQTRDMLRRVLPGTAAWGLTALACVASGGSRTGLSALCRCAPGPRPTRCAAEVGSAVLRALLLVLHLLAAA